MVIMNLEQLGEGEMTKTYVCEICHKTIFRAHGSGILKKCAKCCRKGRVRH